jgi:hypothetical protein
VSWEIGLACVKLAPLTGEHDLVGISNRGGPIEALAEHVAHEGVRHRVVATHARVDVSNEFPTVGDGDAPLQAPDAARMYSSPPITVNDMAFLAIRLASVRSEGSSPRSIQARYLARQSSTRGVGSVSMASASSVSYPSSRESTNASFEGSSSMGSAPTRLEGAPEGSPNTRVPDRGQQTVWQRLARKRSGER